MAGFRWSAACALALAAGLMAARPAPARAQSAADSAAVRQAALDFEESWYTGDAERMARTLHPAFRMVHVGTDSASGRSVLDQDWTALDLIAWTRAGRGEVPPARQRHDVTVLDIYQNAATAKIIAWYGVDYLQLAKWNGRWRVMNVLWGRSPAPM